MTVVVASTHDEIIKDPSKNVFVKYYAPWCGFCKALAPTWVELADHFYEDDDIVIADFDADANRAPGVDINGFPTLIFYPKDNKEGIDYEEGRELSDLISWVEENASRGKGAVKEEL